MGRTPDLSTACAYGTFLYTPMASKCFIASRRASSNNSSTHLVCNRLVLILAYLIFCACMDCLAKHGCIPSWMLPAARTSPVHFLRHLQRLREHSYGPLVKVPESTRVEINHLHVVHVHQPWYLGHALNPRPSRSHTRKVTYCTKSDSDIFSSRILSTPQHPPSCPPLTH